MSQPLILNNLKEKPDPKEAWPKKANYRIPSQSRSKSSMCWDIPKWWAFSDDVC